MMEYPWRCACGRLNMIDLRALDRRAVDKLVTAEGFTCTCGGWNPVFYWTESLRAALIRLEKMDVQRRDFLYHFNKVRRKAEGVREKSEL